MGEVVCFLILLMWGTGVLLAFKDLLDTYK